MIDGRAHPVRCGCPHLAQHANADPNLIKKNT